MLFQILRTLTISSTTQDQALCQAAEFILAHQHKRGAWLPTGIDLSFASDAWQRLVLVRRRVRQRRKVQIVRRQLEVCVFTYLAHELKTGDLCVAGAEQYADYRTHLLPWNECAPQVADYCRELGFPATPGAFVAHLKAWLIQTAAEVDRAFPDNKQVEFNAKGVPTIKRPPPRLPSPTLRPLIEALQTRVPQRNLLDIVHTVEHWTHWSRHFGPLSGADPKIDDPRTRYIVTAFTYGCNLGPAQMARHLRGHVSPHQLWHANHRHITVAGLDAALRDIINRYSRFALPRLWSKAKVAAADGTQFALNEASLASEYHIRHGSSGGVAYHHISDMYIALFSHFIVCGVWEAVYILDLLKKNTSEIQPDTLHADTQGQSAPVFGMAHLLGIDLMPRIRNWKDLIFYRPSKDTVYPHIDPLFSDVIDWALIETHWQDLLQVVLSIQAGKVLPSTLLRKLTNYSRKNRLYQAFREVGRVVRTVFLLKYLARLDLREQIHASTNKVEVYNEFTQWLGFGGEEISDKDPVEIEKRIKYRD
ncbi:MAG: transposase, partial [Chloroflexota bacterium]|nr:transposase [Chloroflexota bacterium]